MQTLNRGKTLMLIICIRKEANRLNIPVIVVASSLFAFSDTTYQHDSNFNSLNGI